MNLFQEQKFLTSPCIEMLQIILNVHINFEEFMTNNFYHNYDTRRARHEFFIFPYIHVYVGVQVSNKSSHILC